MIVISDGEPPTVSGSVGLPLESPLPDGAPEEVRLTRAGSGSNSFGTVEYNYSYVGVRNPISYPRYRPVIMTTDAIGILHRFLGEFMKKPRDGFDPTIPGLKIALQGWIYEVEEGVHRGDDNPKFNFLRVDRIFVNSEYFGLDDIRMIHRFLEKVIRPPNGGFSSSVLDLRFRNLAHIRWMREQVTTSLSDG